MVAVVSAFDLSSISSISGLEVWSQHLDPVGQGSHTGWLEPETALARGAVGTIINHAEHKVSIEHVSKLMSMLPDGFPICACAADVDEESSQFHRRPARPTVLSPLRQVTPGRAAFLHRLRVGFEPGLLTGRARRLPAISYTTPDSDFHAYHLSCRAS